MTTEEMAEPTSEAMGKPPFGSTFGFWEIISLAAAGLLFCFVAIGCQCVRRKQDSNSSHEEEEEEEALPSWFSSFWPGEDSSDQPANSIPKRKRFFSRSNTQVSPTAGSRRREDSDDASFSSESYLSDGGSFDDSVSNGSLSSASY